MTSLKCKLVHELLVFFPKLEPTPKLLCKYFEKKVDFGAKSRRLVHKWDILPLAPQKYDDRATTISTTAPSSPSPSPPPLPSPSHRHTSLVLTVVIRCSNLRCSDLNVVDLLASCITSTALVRLPALHSISAILDMIAFRLSMSDGFTCIALKF